MKKKLVASAVVAALAVTAGAIVTIRRGQADSVAVAPGPIHEIVIAQGSVVATAGTAEVRALIDGRLIEVHVREGDLITAGQLLARFDTAEIDAAIAQATSERILAEAALRQAQAGGRNEERRAADAELDGARAALALEDTRAKRDSDLAEKGAVADAVADESRRNADVARARVARAEAERTGMLRGRPEQIDAARARLGAAEAALTAATARRERSVIVAPIAGVVLSRQVDPGDSVVPGATLFELANPGATELLIEVEDVDAMRMATKLEVVVTSLGGRAELARGVVDRLSPRLNRRTIGASEARMRAETQVRSAWVKWNDDAGRALPLGARVEARVQLPAKEVQARVPRAAVKVREGHTWVEVAHYGLLADERRVVLGVADRQWVEVRGLSPGTRVVSAVP